MRGTEHIPLNPLITEDHLDITLLNFPENKQLANFI